MIDEALKDIKRAMGSGKISDEILELTEEVDANVNNKPFDNKEVNESLNINNGKSTESFVFHSDLASSDRKQVLNEQHCSLGNKATSSYIDEAVMKKSQDILKEFVKTTHNIAELNHSRVGITLEELVVDLLKPQLSAWLNNNLPSLVQNIIEKELKKIIPNE